MDNDRVQMVNTTAADNFLNLIYGIQQSSAQPITLRVIASGSGIVGPPSASAFGINLILTDSGGLGGTILADVSMAFPADTWPEAQFEVTATPSAPAYYLYAYIFARYTNGTLTVRDAEVFQAGTTAAQNGYWRSAPLDAWQAAGRPITSGALAPTNVGFYYGDLSNVDNRNSVNHSIAALSAFPMLVCNEPGSNTTTRQQAVQDQLVAAGVKLYGYVNIGVTEAQYNGCIPPASAITAAIDRCATAGYAGVFLDAAGQPGIPTDYLNYLRGYCQGKTPVLAVFANSHPQDCLSTAVNSSVLQVPSVAPAPTAAAGSTALAAGTYEFSYTCLNYDGETPASPIGSVTITAGQQIDIADISGFDTNTQSLNLYMSVAAGSATLGKVLNWDGAATTITALPPGGAAAPPTSNTAYTANPNGIASTLGSGDWLLWESFYSRSDNQYAGVPEGGFQIVMDEYVSGVPMAHAQGVRVAALAYALTGTPLTSTTDQINSYLLAIALGFDGWRYGGETSNNLMQWGIMPSPPMVGTTLQTAMTSTMVSISPQTWQATTDQGVVWFSATDSPVSRSAGTFAVGNTPPALSVMAPSAQVDAGRVTPLVEGSADKSTWATYNPASPTRYVRYTVTLQD